MLLPFQSISCFVTCLFSHCRHKRPCSQPCHQLGAQPGCEPPPLSATLKQSRCRWSPPSSSPGHCPPFETSFTTFAFQRDFLRQFFHSNIVNVMPCVLTATFSELPRHRAVPAQTALSSKLVLFGLVSLHPVSGSRSHLPQESFPGPFPSLWCSCACFSCLIPNISLLWKVTAEVFLE